MMIILQHLKNLSHIGKQTSHVSLGQHFNPYSHGWAPHKGTFMDSGAIQRKSMTLSSWDDIHFTHVVFLYSDDDNSAPPHNISAPNSCPSILVSMHSYLLLMLRRLITPICIWHHHLVLLQDDLASNMMMVVTLGLSVQFRFWRHDCFITFLAFSVSLSLSLIHTNSTHNCVCHTICSPIHTRCNHRGDIRETTTTSDVL